VFDPRGRWTAAQCLEHRYVAQFHEAAREAVAREAVTMSIDDAGEHSVQDYVRQIYKEAAVPATCGARARARPRARARSRLAQTLR
jgi:mitogen-activated protein kinase 15